MNFTIKFGEKRISNLDNIRAYFFGVTPTGFTKILKEFPQVKIDIFYPKDEDGVGNRFMRIKYKTQQKSGLVIRMFLHRASLGNPYLKKSVDIELDENAPEIKVSDIYGYFWFEGCGRIKEKSIPSEFMVETLNPAKTSDKADDHGILW